MLTKNSKKFIVSRNIFGPYIFKMQVVPGCQEINDNKKRERELFDMVDDYIEEA